MKVGIISAVRGRIPLTRQWWYGVTRIREVWKEGGIDTEVVVAGDEREHHQLCVESGGWFVQAENDPLGAKWNAASIMALRLGVDFLFVLGTDDFFSNALLKAYLQCIRYGVPYAGLDWLFFLEPATGRAFLFDGPAWNYRGNEPVGAGRLIRTDLTNPVEGKPWGNDRNRGLDFSMTKRLGLRGMPCVKIPMGGDRVAVDVKTGENMWDMAYIESKFPGAPQLDPISFMYAIPEARGIMEIGKAQRVRTEPVA